jgi:hypothetical protein
MAAKLPNQKNMLVKLLLTLKSMPVKLHIPKNTLAKLLLTLKSMPVKLHIPKNTLAKLPHMLKSMLASRCLQSTKHSRVTDRLLNHPIKATLINSLFAGLLILFCAGSVAESTTELSPERSAGLFYVEDIKSTMQTHVTKQLDDEGIFHLKDDKTDENLALKFVMVHDPVRQIRGDIYFACTDFHVQGEPEKIYDIDFWLDGSSGELKVYDTKVHKEPRSSLLYGWFKHPRYTFVNDEVEYLY